MGDVADKKAAKAKEYYVDLAAAYPDEKDAVTAYMVAYVFAADEVKDAAPAPDTAATPAAAKKKTHWYDPRTWF